ncbi:MAG: carboxypeptidase regulatory-like domain-containing protein [Terracidiphilus sp.]
MISIARVLTQTVRKWYAPILTAAALLGLAVCVPNLQAQSGAGSIQGTVTDATGAVIPGASVSAVNTATNVTVGTRSNGVGFFVVPGLNTGTYTVTVTAPGMKTYKRTIELLVGQTFVANATMTAGAVTQQVTVSANTVELTDTTNGAISSTLENARINQLPMNGRDIVTLVNEVTPGLESCPESSSCANGESGPATIYEVDGATLENLDFGGVHQGSSQVVDPDALQEVRVEDEDAGAQYAAPATVILNTKSGTNQFHGTGFWTARNNGFGIARARDNPSGYVAPEYIRNEFGASIGGPIEIPHLYHGKDKTFFFFAYERYSLAQNPFQSEKVATPQMVNGDFSQALNSSGLLETLYDPTTTGAYNTGANQCAEPSALGTAASSNAFCRETYTQEYNETGGGAPSNCNGDPNCMPLSQQSALFKTLMAMQPNTTGKYGELFTNISPVAGDNFDGTVRELNIEPQLTWRLDHVFNENNRAYLRYTQNITQATSPRNDPVKQSYTLPATAPGGAQIPAEASGTSYTVSNVYAAALGFTHVFSPTFYSETVLSQTWYGEHNLAGGSPNTDFESELGLPNNFTEVGFPEISGNFSEPSGTQFQYSVTSTIYNADENFTKILGKHQLLFGGRYRFEHIGSIPDEVKDNLEFDDDATALSDPAKYSASGATAYSDSGDANADMFLGAGYDYSATIEPPYQHLHDMELDGYFQDNWRARNNLTLNLGLRYEAHPAMWMGRGQMESFDFKNDAIVFSGPTSQLVSEGLTTQPVIANDQLDLVNFETPSQAGLPNMLLDNFNLNFAPRVGAAWQPFGKWGTVLRGAVGEYYYPTPVREAMRLVSRNNPLTVGYSENYTSDTYTPHGGYMMLSGPNYSPSYTNDTVNTSSPFGPASSPTGAYVPTPGWPIMGFNTSTIVNSSTTTAIQPGMSIVSVDPDTPPSTVYEANFSIEQPLKGGSVARISYIYTHGKNLNNWFYYNDHPSEYVWEIQQAAETPSGSGIDNPYNSSTGEGPFDNLTYGDGSYEVTRTGWSNYNGLQVNYQKLYHNGTAWQIMYVWSRSMRTGGDYGGENADDVDPYSSYVESYQGNYVGAGTNSVTVAPADAASSLPIAPNLPPPPPAGVQPWQYYKALNRWENYMTDTNNPPQHLQFNTLIDIPVGRGKRWLANVNKPVNEAIGGWQIAGSGDVRITDFAITNSNWGAPAASGAAKNSIHIYKHKMPIVDCSSGTCLKEYEWFNGYIAPSVLTGTTIDGQAGCAGSSAKTVTGLKGNWAPYQVPLDISCIANGSSPSTDKYYGDNDVAMSNVGVGSANGKVQKNGTVISYSPTPSEADNGASEKGINVASPFGHTVLNGPMNWGVNASLFKVFPIKENLNVRFNVDAFNLFNNQGLANPSGTTGETCYQAGETCGSENSPRQIQLSLRIDF